MNKRVFLGPRQSVKRRNSMTMMKMCPATAIAVLYAATTFGASPSPRAFSSGSSGTSETGLITEYCSSCHNDELNVGNFSLDEVDVNAPERHAEKLEKVALKLKAGMMPPAGMPRPSRDETLAFVRAVEIGIDDAAKRLPNPGRPVLHRLNRVEYRNSVRDLLELEFDVESLLPPDDMTRGFDNLSDVLTVSPTLLESYISAAGKISRLAVGDVDAAPAVETYVVPSSVSQLGHVEATPFGTRGGTAVRHNFPADGDYVIRLSLYFRSLGPLFGDNKPAEGEQIEVAVNGERVALFDIDRKMKVDQDLRTPRIHIKAGPQKISASFISRYDGPVQDFVMPFEQATADLTTGNVKGLTGLPHLRNLGIDGPYDVTGVGDTPSRRRVFVCRPETQSQEPSCAEDIISVLARRAFRRPVSREDLDNIIALYESGRSHGGFDTGIRTALQAILADPEFIFRFERQPDDVAPGSNYRISDIELASRLSYFLWSSAPDDELIDVAANKKLREPAVLEAQVHRMLADPRAKSLATNFASHWLRLQNLDDVHPDVYLYPDWDANLTRSMREETLLLFNSVVDEDRSIVDLLTSDYTFVDARLARHYEMANVVSSGKRFRRVPVEDEYRVGLLGHGSILTLTSLSNRTSPVIRGAWIMDVLLGTPPPKPPAEVPPLDENTSGETALSVRERLEQHRANPACASCHDMMDPLGFSLENFDPVGAWRTKDAGFDIDPSGTFFDGSQTHGPADLRAFLLRNESLYQSNFARNFLMYALGRVVRHYDMPSVRSIVARAAEEDHRFSVYVIGIVETPAFQMRRAVPALPITDATGLQ